MSDPASVFLERGGVRLHALDHAPGEKSKPILLLLHGTAAHAHWWDWTAPALCDLFRPVALDVRGHGDSDWADDYGAEAFTGDLQAWIDWARRETGRPPAVVGHSMGGMIALHLHDFREPEISALVVVDTALRLREEILQEVRQVGSRPSRPWASLEEFVAKFRMIPTAGKADPERIAYIARHSVRQLEDGTWLLKADRGFHRDRKGFDNRGSWLRVKAPAMYLAGELSDRLTPEDKEWFRRDLAHVKVEVVPGAHHHVFMDEPEAFLRALRGFLERVS
ncbi:MAG: alpha/beta hydrolase [Candidatus Tectomicrobia bacterium]|uniref:Alpha/beta hydrolase n=1 Tax=Tectimicrobiota bacterium TaxID=2528274 RepID=A0A932MLN7_UNCTE|nr:alpha/beta hydrolase [Candidatus Tectomicrobia bacterium]